MQFTLNKKCTTKIVLGKRKREKEFYFLNNRSGKKILKHDYISENSKKKLRIILNGVI